MIEVRHLTKKYGSHTAVSDLSFTIDKGQIYGFLGPNGAGKSTTMNIMTGCLAATEGEVLIDGYDIFEDAQQAKKLIGYLPEQPPLYMDRTPREYLRFVAEAKGLPAAEVKKQVAHALEVTRTEDVADRLIRNLSKGYRQRVGIAQALIGDPEVIILDEPTVGLDPRQIMEIRELIRRLGKDHTIILSSHILSEVQAICSTILIISNGKLVACDTPDNLERLFAGSIRVELTAEASPAETEKLARSVAGVETVETKQVPKSGKTAAVINASGTDGDAVCRALFFAFSKAGRPILRMNMVRANLEDVFMELTSAAAAGRKEAQA